MEIISSRKKQDSRKFNESLLETCSAEADTVAACPGQVQPIANPHASKRTMEMYSSYPRLSDFTRKFNLSDLQRWASAPHLCGMRGAEYCMFAPNAPTIGMMADAYGPIVTAGWLGNHINHLLQMFSMPAEKKPTVDMLRMTGLAWITSWPQLKITEIWVFFFDVISGKYGQVAYGCLELSSLGSYLSIHIATRLQKQARVVAHAKAQKMQAELERTNKERKNAISLYKSEAYKALPQEQQKSLRDFVGRFIDIQE